MKKKLLQPIFVKVRQPSKGAATNEPIWVMLFNLSHTILDITAKMY